MCYWVGTKKVREEMLRRFHQEPEDEIAQLYYETFLKPGSENEFKEHYVVIGKAKPTLTTLIKEKGILKFKNMRWTLPYSYFNKKTNTVVKRELLNSTCERIFFQHKEQVFTKRCLIPLDGYFEYYHFNNETYPHFIFPTDEGIFYAGGIWDAKEEEKTGEIIETFSIITTPPNKLTAKIHNNPKAPNGPRMLLFIKPEEALDYLNPDLKTDEIKQFFKSYDAERMKAHTVLRFLKKENRQHLDTARIRAYFEYEELIA